MSRSLGARRRWTDVDCWNLGRRRTGELVVFDAGQFGTAHRRLLPDRYLARSLETAPRHARGSPSRGCRHVARSPVPFTTRTSGQVAAPLGASSDDVPAPARWARRQFGMG